MSFCRNCGAPLGEGDRFCPACGAPAEQQDTSGQRSEGGGAPFGQGADFRGQQNPGRGYQGFTYDPVGTVDTLVGRMRTLSTAWTVIGIIQIVIGILTICGIVGIAPLIMGIYNVNQGSALRKKAEAFQQWPVGILDFFSQRETTVIVVLILNIFLGFLIGIIGSILEFWAKNYAMDHREELRMAEDMANRAARP